jgi:hypothetical protein
MRMEHAQLGGEKDPAFSCTTRWLYAACCSPDAQGAGLVWTIWGGSSEYQMMFNLIMCFGDERDSV